MINNKLSKTDVLLLSHNISPALKGYTFIKYILENKDITINTKLYKLYEEISEKFNTTTTAAQECIQYAFKNSDFDKKNSRRNLMLLAHEFKMD